MLAVYILFLNKFVGMSEQQLIRSDNQIENKMFEMSLEMVLLIDKQHREFKLPKAAYVYIQSQSFRQCDIEGSQIFGDEWCICCIYSVFPEQLKRVFASPFFSLLVSVNYLVVILPT